VTLAHRIWLAAALPLALSALGGCGAKAGGQTGEETDDGCVFASSPLSLQEPSPLGFSAGQVLALAEGQQSAAFGWLQTTGFSYGPESGTGQVTVATPTVSAVYRDPTKSALSGPPRPSGRTNGVPSLCNRSGLTVE